jgi:cytochrome c-type biogenesis protein CcmH
MSPRGEYRSAQREGGRAAEGQARSARRRASEHAADSGERCTFVGAMVADVMGTLRRVLVALVVTLAACGAHAKEAVPTQDDPVASKRAVQIEEQLRCLVCQNQTIAESNAELAQDLRRQVHEQIAAGKSDAEIVQYMVDRYGDFVLYRPPFKATTALLWGGPAVLLLVGVVALVRVLRTRTRQREEPALTAEERERAARLLDADTTKEAS